MSFEEWLDRQSYQERLALNQDWLENSISMGLTWEKYLLETYKNQVHAQA